VGAEIYLKKVSWRDNPFFPDVLDLERRKLERDDPVAYKHIWEGEPDERYSGTVYAKWVAKAQAEGRFRTKLYDETLPVHTAWDLGYDDATAIWFWQKAGTEIRLIDYYENAMQDIEHYCELLVAKGYKYGTNYVPHDAANKLLAAGGRSIIQQAYALGVKMTVVPATSQQNQIEATRKVLNYSWFDNEMCKNGISSLLGYKFEYDTEKAVFKSKPTHDWTSHGADAFEIIGQVFKNEVLLPSNKVKSLPTSFINITADELFWGESGSKYDGMKI
jgi:phage terminase large subunit